MSDLRLRQLAREARACPSAETESALLRERLRTGELSLERLELAAYCGHEGAQATLDARIPTLVTGLWLDEDQRPVHTTKNSRIEEWVRGLSRWGTGVETMAAIAAANAGDLVLIVRGLRDSTGGVLDVDAGGTAMAAAREAGEAPVREAIQSALIAWALGEGK